MKITPTTFPRSIYIFQVSVRYIKGESVETPFLYPHWFFWSTLFSEVVNVVTYHRFLYERRSYRRNLSSCEKKALKSLRLYWIPTLGLWPLWKAGFIPTSLNWKDVANFSPIVEKKVAKTLVFCKSLNTGSSWSSEIGPICFFVLDFPVICFTDFQNSLLPLFSFCIVVEIFISLLTWFPSFLLLFQWSALFQA